MWAFTSGFQRKSGWISSSTFSSFIDNSHGWSSLLSLSKLQSAMTSSASSSVMKLLHFETLWPELLYFLLLITCVGWLRMTGGLQLSRICAAKLFHFNDRDSEQLSSALSEHGVSAISSINRSSSSTTLIKYNLFYRSIHIFTILMSFAVSSTRKRWFQTELLCAGATARRIVFHFRLREDRRRHLCHDRWLKCIIPCSYRYQVKSHLQQWYRFLLFI